MKLLFVALTSILFVSCLEINEDVEIKSNGSGNVTTVMDLSQLVDMMQAMGGEEFEKKKDEKLDSIISLRSITDTASNLTAEQKSLMRDGTIRVQMNMAEKLFKLTMRYPFEDLDKLQKLTTAMSNGSVGFGNIMKDAMGDKKKDSMIIDQPAQESPEMDQLMSIFDYSIKNGTIKKSVNAERLKKLQDNPKMAEMKQGADMGIEVLYTTTYKLPRPVKKVDNPSAKVSDDKMSVTVRQNLMLIFTQPEKFAFTIEY
ncbi:MAG TPA: hypothetical protein VJT83_09740 [Chitinophagaceae bacterium]|nr:hypothetical protein [Chitinophagaceae bacterium]